jgi:PAS domain S-box-containing protein
MDRILKGYSGWNDTYQYAQDQNSQYINTNFQEGFLASNGISGVIICNRAGDIIFQMIQDPSDNQILPLPDAQIQNISKISDKFNLGSKTSGTQGIVTLGQNDALITSEPILTDSYQGPSQGSIHFILWLDESFFKRITNTRFQTIQYQKVPIYSESECQPDEQTDGFGSPEVTILPINTSHITGSFCIPGILRSEKFQFTILMDRPIYQSGVKSIYTIIFFLLLSGVFIGIIILAFIDRVLLSRIESISRKISKIWSESILPPSEQPSLEIRGQNELDILEHAIDPVFAHIIQTHVEKQRDEDFFHRVTDAIQDGLLIFEKSNGQEKLVYCNPRSLEIFGGTCTYADIPDLLSCVVSEEKEQVYRQWDEISKQSHPNGTIGFWILNHAGERRYILTRFSFIRSEPDFMRILVVISDLTERKIIEESLSESEAKYRYMTENISDVHWQMTPNLLFTYISPADEILRGYRSDEVIGRTVWDFIPPYAHSSFKKIITSRHGMHKSGEKLDALIFELEWLRKNGSIMWIEVMSNPIYDCSGSLVGFHGIYRDITERKIADAAIIQANKKINLLSSITRHDVLNQMTVIISTLELMNEEDLPPVARSLIQTEDEAADKIIRLIQFARDYQDIGLNAPQWFKLEEIVQRARESINTPEITITIKIGYLSIFADALLEKVFFNLIDNSIRHGGSVTSITLDGYTGEEGFHLIFSDNGGGISPDEHMNIFTRGYGKNTGMGLFLIREILSITGISIEENGTFGVGARFEMIIPEGRYKIHQEG